MTLRLMHRGLAIAMLLATFGSAQAVHCLPSGRSVAYTKDGLSEIFFLNSQADSDYVFHLPGGDYESLSERHPGSDLEFVLDSVLYGFSTAKASSVSEAGQSLDATELLPRYAAWMQKRLKEVQPVYPHLQELARTRRPEYKSTPVMFFQRWRLGVADPEDVRGVYYLSTVNDGRVASIAAHVANPEQLKLVMSRFDRFATSYRVLEADDDCPDVSDDPPDKAQ